MPQGKKVYERKKGRKEDLDCESINWVLPDYQNPLLMVQRMVLETGGSRLSLRRTKHFEDVVC